MTAHQPAMRWCPVCKSTLALTKENFYVNPTCVGGFTARCRGCTNISKRESDRLARAKRGASA